MTITPDATEVIAVAGTATPIDIVARRWAGGATLARGFVLVHGLASNARLWDGVAIALAAAGHPVLAIDQRGHGQSSKPDDGYDMATITDDLRAVVDRAAATWPGFTPDDGGPVLVGQSWGGNVVIEFAARFPGVASAIVGIDGGTITLSDAFPEWADAAEALRPPPLVGRPVAEIEGFLRAGHPDWPTSGIEGTLACFDVRADGTIAPWLTLERHLSVLRGLWEHRPVERYASITDPVHLIAADDASAPHDFQVAKRAAHEAAAAAIADAQVHWMAGDHDLHAQFPVQIADMLRTVC